ncbi:class I SAM-dependent methyltransferase [Actinomycetospora sp. CA-084318]|uniref:class I SAM-dependent methyltransferase n=1 Tax=Actinomycetospora sp. CA-084318 TaxID=3239892 RepID=UPI003D96E912
MSLPDFDATYRGTPLVDGAATVPWNIGVPQPPIAALIDGGRVAGPVLDAGCGVGVTTIELARRGVEAVGIDRSATAIAQAREAAAAAGVDAAFEVADISAFTRHDGRFATVVDCTLFHSLPVELRPGYVASIARAARPGAALFVLAFDVSAPFTPEMSPNCVTADELATAVEGAWAVESVVDSTIHVLELPLAAEPPRDEQGRLVMPAHLLTAHRRPS